jgi:hypothetical protein
MLDNHSQTKQKATKYAPIEVWTPSRRKPLPVDAASPTDELQGSKPFHSESAGKLKQSRSTTSSSSWKNSKTRSWELEVGNYYVRASTRLFIPISEKLLINYLIN